MTPITGTTTLADLDRLFTRLGVINATIYVSLETLRPVHATLTTLDFRALGVGETICEALDAALARLWHQQSASTSATGSTPGDDASPTPQPGEIMP